MSVIDNSKPSIEKMLSRAEALKSERSSWNNMFQEVVDYVLPNRQSFTGIATQGKQTGSKQFDSTAPYALDQLAAALHTYLTGDPRWFRLDLPNSVRAEIPDSEEEEVNRWLDVNSDIIYELINSPKTNFHPQLHEAYIDCIGFGTAVLYVEEGDSRAPLTFCTYHMSKVAFSENSRGIVNEVYRDFDLSAGEAYERYGESLPTAIKEAARNNPKKMYAFMHVAIERLDRDETLPNSTNMPYASYIISIEEKALVKESGYNEFPYMVPRWSKLTGERLGRGPAILSMPDIRMINVMAKTILRAGQKVVDPPLQLPDEGYLMPINQAAGGLTFFNSTLNPEMRATPLSTGGRVDIGEEMLQARQKNILRAFYADWLMSQQSVQKTATQVMQDTEDRMRLMSPAVSRLQSELLAPMLERVYNIAQRKGYLTPAPDAIKDRELVIEYISPVARAQKMVRMTQVQRMLESLSVIAQVKPEVFDRVDVDGYVDFMADELDVSYRILLPMSEVTKNRADRKAQQDALANSQGLNQDMDSLNKGASAMSNLQGAMSA